MVPPPTTLDEPGFRSLVTIQRGNENLIPFFCIHGSGGNVLNFRDLSQAMGRSQPFYGLQSRGIDGVSRPHHSIEEMANAYLAEIREVQPEGPYMLGGYSGGGLVAFEMAHQLTAAGETVALVVMFDTFPPKIADRDITVAMRLRRLRNDRMRLPQAHRDAARRRPPRRRRCWPGPRRSRRAAASCRSSCATCTCSTRSCGPPTSTCCGRGPATSC